MVLKRTVGEGHGIGMRLCQLPDCLEGVGPPAARFG
jgi:hypothetical protein